MSGPEGLVTGQAGRAREVWGGTGQDHDEANDETLDTRHETRDSEVSCLESLAYCSPNVIWGPGVGFFGRLRTILRFGMPSANSGSWIRAASRSAIGHQS
jgi:hypothetical protein